MDDDITFVQCNFAIEQGLRFLNQARNTLETLGARAANRHAVYGNRCAIIFHPRQNSRVCPT